MHNNGKKRLRANVQEDIMLGERIELGNYVLHYDLMDSRVFGIVFLRIIYTY